jgi:hypothetical protein
MTDRDTHPDELRPSQPLMDMRESYALGQALHGLDALAKYLGGKLDGDVADAANRIASMVLARQDQFEAEALRRMEEMRGMLINLSGDTRAIRGTLKPLGIHLGELQAEHARNHGPVELRLSEPPASKPEAEAL